MTRSLVRLAAGIPPFVANESPTLQVQKAVLGHFVNSLLRMPYVERSFNSGMDSAILLRYHDG